MSKPPRPWDLVTAEPDPTSPVPPTCEFADHGPQRRPCRGPRGPGKGGPGEEPDPGALASWPTRRSEHPRGLQDMPSPPSRPTPFGAGLPPSRHTWPGAASHPRGVLSPPHPCLSEPNYPRSRGAPRPPHLPPLTCPHLLGSPSATAPSALAPTSYHHCPASSISSQASHLSQRILQPSALPLLPPTWLFLLSRAATSLWCL